MNLKKLSKVVLNILNKDQFETDSNGQLVLNEEQKGRINESFKFSENFADLFENAWNENASGTQGGNLDETALQALNDAMKLEVTQQVKASTAQIEANLRKEYEAKLEKANAEKQSLSEQKSALEKEKETLASEKTSLQEKVETLSDETETDTADVNLNTTGVKSTPFNANRKFFHNTMAFEFVEKGYSSHWEHANTAGFTNRSMGGGSDDSIDVSEINEEFGIYLTGQRRLEIIRELLRPTGSRNYMTRKLGIERWRASQSQMTEIVQQFIAKWTPKGQAKFTPIEIINRRHKINLPIVPDDITGGWLTYLYNEGVTPDQMPVVRYVIEVLLRDQIDDDIEYSMIATGEYEELGEVTEGDVGQDASKAMDGFVTIIRKQNALAEPSMRFFKPAYEWSKDNSLKFMTDFAKFVKADQYGVKLHAKGMNAFVDPDMYELFKEKYQETYPFTKNSDKDNDKIDFSNLTLVPLENMRGTQTIFTTPKSNFIELHHRNEAGGATKLFLQVQNYEVRVFGEFWLSVGFAIGEFVFAYTPEAEVEG